MATGLGYSGHGRPEVSNSYSAVRKVLLHGRHLLLESIFCALHTHSVRDESGGWASPCIALSLKVDLVLQSRFWQVSATRMRMSE